MAYHQSSVPSLSMLIPLGCKHGLLVAGALASLSGHAWGTALYSNPDWAYQVETGNSTIAMGAKSVGDVNGDTDPDAIISDDIYNGNGIYEEGKLYLYLGGATGLAATPAWTWSCGQSSVYATEVAGHGDVNGDGFGDVVVASDSFNN